MAASLILLKRDLFHAPGLFAHQLFQAFEQLGADARGVVGEVYQVAFAVFVDLETEFVASVMRDERAVQGFDAAFVAFPVAGGAQEDGDLARRVVFVFVFFGERDVER